MKTIVIPDIHEDYLWLQRIVNQHKDDANFILLGDYADSKRDGTNLKETATSIKGYKVELGRRFVCCIGNHDAQYWETYHRAAAHHGIKKETLNCATNSYNNSRASAWAKCWGENEWKALVPFTTCGGWLLSHAGIHPKFVRGCRKEEYDGAKYANETNCSFIKNDSLPRLWTDAKYAWDNCRHHTNPLFQRGEARGGNKGIFGGLTWLDWDEEFVDAPEMPPQIVGHTKGYKPRSKGKNINLDCGQKYIGVIHGGGRLRVEET